MDAWEGSRKIMRASCVVTGLPLLGSEPTFEVMGMILNLFLGVARFVNIGAYNVPVTRAENGHLVIDLTDFDMETLMDVGTWTDTDADVTIDPTKTYTY